MRNMRWTLALLALTGCAYTPSAPTNKVAIPASLAASAELVPNTRQAKNVIVFVGDGMGISTITAGRIFDGQARGVDGESNSLSFERLPYTALIKTYNTNQQVPDSAGTATALFTGAKTRAGLISVGPAAFRQDCAGGLANPLTSVLDLAENKGLATGIVTSTRLTHATPATLYAKSPERGWEDDTTVPNEAKALGCRDIATQLTTYASGDGPDVILGGGRANFLPRSDGGRRADGRNLLAEWRDARSGRQVVATAEDLAAASLDGQIFGAFAPSHLTYVQEREAANTEPTLTAMTLAALDRLEQSEPGYFLMVEGGRIDHGHHQGIAGLALTELRAFSEAIEATLERVNLDDTLVLVTADHSHVFTMAGYPTRGNNIFGLVVGNDATGRPSKTPTLADDEQPYTTLGYANGPGAKGMEGARPRPTTGQRAIQQALVPTFYENSRGEHICTESHGGEDVSLYAAGPWAHLARGVLEQNVVFDLITLAYGWTSD